MVLVNFLHIEENEVERFKTVINSLERDKITPLLKNIINRLKEVDNNNSKSGGDDKDRKDKIRGSIKDLVKDPNFILLNANNEAINDADSIDKIVDYNQIRIF